MKLLYITEDRFPPFRADVEELFARRLGGDHGMEIDWFMQRGPKAPSGPSLAKWHGQTVYLTPRMGGRGLPGRLLNAVIALLGEWFIIPLALRNRYDAIQVRDKFFTCIPAWIAARMSGARFLYWMSYPFPESRLYLARQNLTNKRFSFLLKGYVTRFLLYRFIAKVADHIFVQSEQMLTDVAHEGVSRAKMSVVLMGIKSEQVKDAVAARKPETTSPIFLYLGTLVRIRHLEFLLEVHQQVLQKYPRARLFFVGEGETPEDRKFLEAEAKRLGVADSVVFTGFLPMEKAWGYVEQADICFSPFFPIPVLLSTSPTKLIEYLAMGKNVVANEHPEQCRVLAESGVGQCVPWDAGAFAGEVVSLLDNPEEAWRKAAKGPDYVRSYRTYAVIAEQVNGIYQRILLGSK